jgi:hypothetical protein
MTVLVETQAPYYKRKIKCPGHYLIPPQVDIYLYEPVPWAKEIRDWVEFRGKQVKLRKKSIRKDAWGRKMIDWKKLHELERQGVVRQPWISASYAIENIYNPVSSVCQLCNKRCFEGKGIIYELGIQRLYPTKQNTKGFGEL